MNTIYKVGDKVFDARFGWGEIVEIDYSITYPVRVKYEYLVNDVSYTFNGLYSFNDKLPSLSFTEYDFIKGGFSQERPEVLPKRGAVVWVRDSDNDKWEIGQFMFKDRKQYKVTISNPFDDSDGFNWKQMTTKNPYTNEQ